MNDVLTIEHYEKVGDVLKKIRLDQGKNGIIEESKGVTNDPANRN